MTHGSGGSFGDGGSGFSSSYEHGRSSGGSFDSGGSNDRSNDYDHRYEWGPNYSSGPVFVNAVQMPPVDPKTQALSLNKSCTVFLLLCSFIGTYWVQIGLYGSTSIGLDVYNSRLVTAHSFFARTMKFTNKGEFQGPVLYSFHNKPDIGSEVRWSDYQNTTMNYWHKEFYYYLNKGSTVRMKSTVKLPERNVVYFKVILGENDLEEFLKRPDEASIRIRGYIEYKFEASADGDYMFAFANNHHVDAEVAFEVDIHSKQYDVRHAKERCDVRTHCELQLSLFGSRYGVLETPGVDEAPVDNWEMEVSYGTRWGPFILLYCLIVLVFLVRRYLINRTHYDVYNTHADREPLVRYEEITASPTAPTMPATILEEEEYAYRKDKEIAEDRLCSVCLDAPKDSFFVPCGHRATCFVCGFRISESDHPTCPICRQSISEVKRIFDA